MIKVLYRDKERGFQRIRGNCFLYADMTKEDWIHIFDGEEMTGIVNRDDVTSIFIDASEER